MKINFTKVAVAIFIAILIWAAVDARAEEGARISLGHTVANSHSTWGEVGYEFSNGWEIAAALNGASDTKNGAQGKVQVFSVSNLVRPTWYFLGARNYYRLGVSYQDGSPLVGSTNFRLGIGLEWSVVQLEYFHYSSAGIHKPNTGIDGIQLRFKF